MDLICVLLINNKGTLPINIAIEHHRPQLLPLLLNNMYLNIIDKKKYHDMINEILMKYKDDTSFDTAMKYLINIEKYYKGFYELDMDT